MSFLIKSHNPELCNLNFVISFLDLIIVNVFIDQIHFSYYLLFHLFITIEFLTIVISFQKVYILQLNFKILHLIFKEQFHIAIVHINFYLIEEFKELILIKNLIFKDFILFYQMVMFKFQQKIINTSRLFMNFPFILVDYIINTFAFIITKINLLIIKKDINLL